MRRFAVAFDMTFPNRNRGSSLLYARSLFAAMRERPDVVAWVVAGPGRTGFRGAIKWLLFGARREVLVKPPDILHCPDSVVPLRLRVPTVVTVHDTDDQKSPDSSRWSLYERRVVQGRLRSAARVIATTAVAKGEVVDLYGIDESKVTVIHNGIDGRLLATPSIPREETRQPVILFPVARAAETELDVILRSIRNADPDSVLAGATLEITGAAESDFPRSARLAAQLGLQTRVQWRGHLAVDDFRAAMRRASVVAYPSLYGGFVFTPLEAMALGTPVVASDSLREVLGDAAVLVDPTDVQAMTGALQSVLERSELRDKLRRTGWTRAQSFTWTRCAEQTVEVYREVLEFGHRNGDSPQ